MKLSFKRQEKPTGLAAIGQPYAHVDIKADKKKCGCIFPPNRYGQDYWKVSLAVKKEPSEESPAPFAWVSFKFQGKDENEAREFVKKYWDKFQEKYDIFQWGD